MDFPTTQILREIYFSKYLFAKIIILTVFESLNPAFRKFQPSKVVKILEIK